MTAKTKIFRMAPEMKMKGYFFLCGDDATDFHSDVLMSIQDAIKSRESFIGLNISKTHALQMRPDKDRGWSIEFLNEDLLNLRWATKTRREAKALMKAVLNSPNPVQLMEKMSVDWELVMLSVDDEGHVSG